MRHILTLLLALCAGSAYAQTSCTDAAPCQIRIFHVTSPGARAAYLCPTTTCPAIEAAINAQVSRLSNAWTITGSTHITAVNAGVYHSTNVWYDRNNSAYVASNLWQDPQMVPQRNTAQADITAAIIAGPGGDSTANCIASGRNVRSYQCGGVAVDVEQMKTTDSTTYQHEVGHPFAAEHEDGSGSGRAFWWRTLEPCPQGANQACLDNRVTQCWYTLGTTGSSMPTGPQVCANGWQKAWISGAPWTCSPREWCDDKAIQLRNTYSSTFGFPVYGVVTRLTSTTKCDPMGFHAQTQTMQIMGGVTIDMGPGQAVTIPATQYSSCTPSNTQKLLMWSNPDKKINDMPVGLRNFADAAERFRQNAGFVASWKYIAAPKPGVLVK